MVTPVVKREAVAHLQVAYEVSQRRACQVISMEYGQATPTSERGSTSLPLCVAVSVIDGF